MEMKDTVVKKKGSKAGSKTNLQETQPIESNLKKKFERSESKGEEEFIVKKIVVDGDDSKGGSGSDSDFNDHSSVGLN